jgi:hypothetical protein
VSLFVGQASALAATYPEAPTRLDHNLAGHPLFTLAGLAALAGRLRPEHVKCCRGDVPVGLGTGVAPETGRTVADTFATMERSNSWVVFRHIEQDPAYRDLIERMLGELEPLARPRTGPMLLPEGFVFVSSPGAITPLHFDPEHNILMQVAGCKMMRLLPAGDEAIMPGVAHERYQHAGENGLEWHDGFAEKAQAFRLAPGDGLYVPVKAPHWVENGDETSISFSITWRSGWSLREGDAHGFNRLARRFGLDPRPTHRYPADNKLKAIFFRCVRKTGLLSDRQ